MNFVFISHKNHPFDNEYCDKLYDYLTNVKKICCWMDKMDMNQGKWSAQIYKKIGEASAYILVSSINSLTSEEVQKEIDLMFSENRGKPFVPFCLDDFILQKDERKEGAGYHLGSASNQGVFVNKYPNLEEAFEKLVSLLPNGLSILENNPDDFVYDGNDETILKEYKGNDSIVGVPGFVHTIDKEAFLCNKNIERVNLPNSIEKIGRYAFLDCENLIDISGLENIKDIHATAFDGTKLINEDDNLVILDGVLLKAQPCDELVLNDIKVVAEEAAKCKRFRVIRFEEGLLYINKLAFVDNFNLEEVEFPASLQYIGRDAFRGCNKISKIILHGEKPQNIEAAFDDLSKVEFVYKRGAQDE